MIIVIIVIIIVMIIIVIIIIVMIIIIIIITLVWMVIRNKFGFWGLVYGMFCVVEGRADRPSCLEMNHAVGPDRAPLGREL